MVNSEEQCTVLAKVKVAHDQEHQDRRYKFRPHLKVQILASCVNDLMVVKKLHKKTHLQQKYANRITYCSQGESFASTISTIPAVVMAAVAISRLAMLCMGHSDL